MKQKLFDQCGLILLKDERRSRLFRVEKQPDGSLKLAKMRYLSEDHSSIEVYPECGLIISSRTIYTLDEKMVVSRLGADVRLYPAGKSWIIVLDYHNDGDMRYCAIWWNGQQKYVCAYGNQLLKSDRYLALFIKFGKYWTVYDLDGTLITEQECLDTQEIEIKGDFLYVHSIGNHAIYSLRKQRQYTLQCSPVFVCQQLILCSKHDDFAICCGMNGLIRSCYRGKFMQFERAEQIDVLDFASLFCLKRGKKFFLYRFNGKPFATDICPEGADVVAADEKNKSVLIGVGENYRLLQKF